MTEPLSHSGYVKRIDALLRASFPNLVTRIFEVKQHQFTIVFDHNLQDASDIANEFDNCIRFITVNVNLSNTLPHTYLNEIQPFTDAEASGCMAGLPLRRIDVLNFLVARFPDAGILDVKDDQPGKSINILLQQHPDDLTKSQLGECFDSLELPIIAKFEIAREPQQINLDDKSNDSLFVWASSFRKRAPSYVARDEAFWFENIKGISSNQFPIKRFPDMQDDVFRCYLDLSLGDEHINLRQALLFYDEVWCSPPPASRQDLFLERQALRKVDLLDMVDAGRLRFVTTQPEEGLDISFLEAVHEHSPTAILGRRTTAALLVADVAQTAETSILNDPSLYPALRQASEIVANEINVGCNELLRTLLWPFVGRRRALQGLLDRGTKGGPILSLANQIATFIEEKFGTNVEMETLLLSEVVHIGHALNATVFGPMDEPAFYHRLKSIIARHLNFHRSFNPQLAASWIENEIRSASGVELLPPVQLFEFERSLPIQEILSDTSWSSTRTRGRGLYSRLVNLSVDERQAEIERLQAELRLRVRNKAKGVLLLDSYGYTGLALDWTLGYVLPSVATWISGAKKIAEKLRRIREIDKMIDRMDEIIWKSEDRQELDFLSRVNRVARLKVDRV